MSALFRLLRRAWEHRELLFILIVVTVLLQAFPLIKHHVDARVGFDGWGDVLYALVADAKMLNVAYGAWLCQVMYHGETPDSMMWQDNMVVETGAMVLIFAQTVFWVSVWYLALFVH